MEGLLNDEQITNHNLRLLKECEAIILLPGWRTSDGSLVEKEFAHKAGIRAVNAEAQTDLFTSEKVVGQLASSVKLLLAA
jgi:hypothetical protein